MKKFQINIMILRLRKKKKNNNKIILNKKKPKKFNKFMKKTIKNQFFKVIKKKLI